jgi:predicted secreted protein
MNSKSVFLAMASLLTALTSGCASITGTTIQSVSVQTVDAAGKEVTGGACELNNKKGKWFITTPGTTTITRSNDDLMVLCKKETYEPGMASVVSAIKGSMFGNILFGGGIGAIIDHNNGSAYEYPATFQVQMGSNKAIDMTKPEGQQIVFKPMNVKPENPVSETADNGDLIKAKDRDSGVAR